MIRGAPGVVVVPGAVVPGISSTGEVRWPPNGAPARSTARASIQPMKVCEVCVIAWSISGCDAAKAPSPLISAFENSSRCCGLPVLSEMPCGPVSDGR